jgi:hypothetical protein
LGGNDDFRHLTLLGGLARGLVSRRRGLGLAGGAERERAETNASHEPKHSLVQLNFPAFRLMHSAAHRSSLSNIITPIVRDGA